MFTSPTEYRFAQFRFLVLSLCVLSVLCVETPSQDYKPVHDGVEYAELTREISGKQVKMNLLRLDLKKVRLDVHHAMDKAIGTETTSSIAFRHGAVGAINAGFFRLDKSEWAGDSVGVLKSKGTVLSESSRDRIAMFISNRPSVTNVEFAHFTNSLTFKIGARKRSVMGINRELKDNETVIFTPSFNRKTLATCDGTSIVVRRNRVSSVRQNECQIAIPSNGYVISASGDQAELIRRMRPKMGARIVINDAAVSFANDPSPMEKQRVYKLTTLYKRSTEITNGVPQLIKNSKIDITWEQEKASKSFVETRHPRTAVAKLKDGKFLMVTVDGRSEESAGIDLYDLAKLLLEFGVTDAMNLDGGGSTTMFLDGKVVNKPSDPTGERKVGDAILVTLRKPKR